MYEKSRSCLSLTCHAYLEPSKVNAGRKLGRRFKDLLEGFLVAEIDFVKDEALFSSITIQVGNFRHAIQGNLAGIDEVVDDHDIVSLFQQADNGMRANVATASGN